MGWITRGLICTLMVTSVVASARGRGPEYVEGFYRTSAGHEIYYKVFPGEKDGAIVASNGLTHDTEHWDTTVPELVNSGKMVVLYDVFLQGRTLEKFIDDEKIWSQIGIRPIVKPLLGEKLIYGDSKPLIPPAPIALLARDLGEMLQSMGIKKATHVGVSFGAALALKYASLYPRRTERLVLVAPYIEPMAAQDKLVRYVMDVYKRTFPLMNFDNDELYDWILRGLVLTTYHLSEPTALKWGLIQPYGISQLASGVRHQDAMKLVRDLKVPLSVVAGGHDQYIQLDRLMEFWEAVPKELRENFVVIDGIEHKANESVGPYLGAMVTLFDQGNRVLHSGRSWIGYPERGLLKSKDGKYEFALPKTPICESILRPTHPGSPNLPVDRIARNPAEIWFHSMRAQLPPEMRKAWDYLAKFYWIQ